MGVDARTWELAHPFQQWRSLSLMCTCFRWYRSGGPVFLIERDRRGFQAAYRFQIQGLLRWVSRSRESWRILKIRNANLTRIFCLQSDEVGCFTRGEGPLAHVRLVPLSPRFIRTKFFLYTQKIPGGITITPKSPRLADTKVFDPTKSVIASLSIVSRWW